MRGDNALAGFDRDVLAQNGLRYLVLLEGINDIKWEVLSERATAEQLIAGLSQLVQRAHSHHIAVFAATLTPCGGADDFSAQGEQARVALNRWIRPGGVVDGAIDFDLAMRDPANPKAMRPNYDSDSG